MHIEKKYFATSTPSYKHLISPFRGLIAAVYTPFTSAGALNLLEIPKYGKYLSENKIEAILVNGTVSEAYLMSVEERKKSLEKWMAVAKEFNFYVMANVGGVNANGVIDLAKHAESVGVDSILSLPDLFFRPANISQLVDYLKIISAAAPKTPLFYYHSPSFTGVILDMVEFLKIGSTEIPTLSGIKYADNNLDEGTRCVELYDRKFTTFLACNRSIAPGLFVGFDSMMPTALSFAHKEIFEMRNKIQKGENDAATDIQRRITDLMYYLEKNGIHSISGMKAIISKVTHLQLGQSRQPIKNLTSTELEQLEEELKLKNWI